MERGAWQAKVHGVAQSQDMTKVTDYAPMHNDVRNWHSRS